MKLLSILIITTSVLNLGISIASIIRSLFFNKDAFEKKSQHNSVTKSVNTSIGIDDEYGRNSRTGTRKEMGKLFVGRGFENDIVIDNPSASKRHAEIYRIDDNYYIRDLNATNGTMLNGVRVMNSEDLELHNGDILQFGNSSYRCFIGGGLIRIFEIPSKQ